MSGHSKWASIKHQKAATDSKRGKIFSKFAGSIALAAKDGGDPNTNTKLRLLVDKAKSLGMPKDNIERAIKRGSGAGGEGAIFEEIIIEAYGPQGSGILIQAATDNKNRTLPEIKKILQINGAKIAQSGSVKYMFKEIGNIVVKKNLWNDDLALMAIESGALDIIEDDDDIIIKTNSQDLNKIKMILEKSVDIDDYYLDWESDQKIQIEDAQEKEKIEKLFNELNDNDDVIEVYSNISF